MQCTHRVGSVDVYAGLEVVQNLVQVSSSSGAQERRVPVRLQPTTQHVNTSELP
jgi:hypothetical protein